MYYYFKMYDVLLSNFQNKFLLELPLTLSFKNNDTCSSNLAGHYRTDSFGGNLAGGYLSNLAVHYRADTFCDLAGIFRTYTIVSNRADSLRIATFKSNYAFKLRIATFQSNHACMLRTY
jgi:hypothetical protein